MTDRRAMLAMFAMSALFVAALAVAQYEPYTWLFRDGRFYANVSENIIRNGSLQDPFAHSWYDGKLGWNYNLSSEWSNVALGRNGEYWHFRPWILPVLATPFYFGAGLFGLLFFNLACGCLVSMGTYRFSRELMAPAPAALSGLAALLASGVRAQLYNYSVDVLLAAAFALMLAAAVTRRGVLAGAMFGITVMIKPTSLMYVPVLAVIVLERRDWRTLLYAIAGASLVLAVYAGANTYMFGRPWWTGYDRTLVVVQGKQQIFTHASYFSTPLEEGARELWSGSDGVKARYPAFVLAPLGALALGRRRPLYVIASVISAAGAYALFSKYTFHQDRFLFPAALLLAPLTGAGAAAIASLARAAWPRVRFVGRAAWTTAALVVACSGATLVAEGSDLPARFDAGYAMTPPAPGAPVALVHWLAAPFAWLDAKNALLAWHFVLLGIAAYATVRLLERFAGPALASGAVFGVTLFSPIPQAVLGDASSLWAAALAAAGLAGIASARACSTPRALLAATLVALAMAVHPSAWPAGVAFVMLAVCARPLVFALSSVWLLVTSAAIWGVSKLGPAAAGLVPTRPEDAPSAHDLWTQALHAFETPNPSRALFVLALLLPLAWVSARARTARHLVAALVVSALLAPFAWLATGNVVTVAAALLASLAIAIVARRAGELATRGLASVRTSGKLMGGLVVSALVVLLVVGVSRRVYSATRPFRLGTLETVMRAEVVLDDRLPCDFFAWENVQWECTYNDGDAPNRVGLAYPKGVRVDGEAHRDLLLIPTARDHRGKRMARWRDVRAGRAFWMRVAYPEGPYGADASVAVDIGPQKVTFVVPHTQRGFVWKRIDTAAQSGKHVTVQITVTPVGGPSTAIALDGGFTW